MDQVLFTYLLVVLRIFQRNRKLLLPSRIRTRYQLNRAEHVNLVIIVPAMLDLAPARVIIIGYAQYFNY